MRKMTTGMTLILAGAGLALAVLVDGSRPAVAVPGPSQVLVINKPIVVAEQSVEISFAGVTIVGPFDVSPYGKVRIFYDLTNPTSGFVKCVPEIVANNGHIFKLDAELLASSFPATKVYDVAGPSFRLSCIQDAAVPPTLHLSIYGL